MKRIGATFTGTNYANDQVSERAKTGKIPDFFPGEKVTVVNCVSGSEQRAIILHEAEINSVGSRTYVVLIICAMPYELLRSETMIFKLNPKNKTA